MAPSHLLFLGNFAASPNYHFLDSLLADYPVRSAAQISELASADCQNAVVLTCIDWLETLTQKQKTALRQQLTGTHLWLVVAATNASDTSLQHWLEQGADGLLPPRFEAQLLNYLPCHRDTRHRSAIILGHQDEEADRIRDMLAPQGYRSRHLPVGISLARQMQRQPPVLIIARDKPGIDQLKLGLHQSNAVTATLIAISDLQDPFLPPPVRHLPRSRLADLPEQLIRQPSPESIRARQRNQRYYQQIAELLQVLGDEALISYTDQAGRIIRTNQRFCEVSGYTEQALLGRTHRMIKSDLHPRTFYTDLWQRLTSGKIWHGVICNRNQQGHLYWISTRMFPITDRQGLIDTYVCISSDISALQHDADKLQQFTTLLQTQRSRHASWQCDLSSGQLYLSSRATGLFGHPPHLPETLTELMQLIDPADRLSALQTFSESLRSGNPFNLSLRLQLNTGREHWFSVSGCPITRPDRQSGQLQGLIKEIEQPASMVESPLFRQLFDASEYSMAISDNSGHLLFTNPAFQRAMGMTETELTGRHCSELISSDKATAQALSQQILSAEQPCHSITTRQRKDGSEFTATNLFGLIRNHCGEITHRFSMFSDISSEVETRQALSADRDAAQQANQKKSEFLAGLGHELRTPLNAILGFAQLLEINPQLGLLQQEQVQAILSAGRHLLEVMNNLLDMSRMEAGQLSLSCQRIDIKHLTDECVTLLTPLADEKQVRIEQQGTAATELLGDRLRLKQVLLNLLSNALHYSPIAATITLRAEQHSADTLRISVIDTGPGIAAGHLNSIFEPFTRIDQNGAHPSGGGMGLAICHEIVHLMGGQIGVHSQPGQGATFWIELPTHTVPLSTLHSPQSGSGPH